MPEPSPAAPRSGRPAQAALADAGAPGGWRVRHLLLAPHRLAFAAGALMLATTALWWAQALAAIAIGTATPAPWPASVVHGLLMTFGFMPLFFSGFFFTALPKWLGHAPIAASGLLAPVLAQVLGGMVLALAAHFSASGPARALGAAGLGAMACGWLVTTVRLAGMVANSTARDKVHAQVMLAGAAMGVLALFGATWALGAGELAWLSALSRSALWGFIGWVFAAAAHRMVPYLSASSPPSLGAWGPQWVLKALVAIFAFEAAAVWVAEPLDAYLAWHLLRAGVEVGAGLALLALAWRWALLQSLRMRMTAMLHLGFCWLGMALVLAGVGSVCAVAGRNPSAWMLAAVHAYGIGFLGSIMFTMVSRISGGLAGRALVADDFLWCVFWALQLVAALRVGTALLPSQRAASTHLALLATALAWCTICALWAMRYGRWYGRPRVHRARP